MSADAAPRVPPVPRGLELDAFRAYRHDPSTGSERPLSFNSFGAAQLLRPVSHVEAAATLAGWIEAGVLRRDTTDTLYVYEQVLPTGRRVRGLLGAIGLSPASAGIVLPHEDTRVEPILDRLALMSATGTDLEPILVLYDGGPVVAQAIDRALAGVILTEVTSSDGSRHRLAGITGEEELKAIAAELRPRQALIADGHHRYASYLSRQASHWAAGDGPGGWDHGLALLVDAGEGGLAIRAIHRVLEGLPLATAVGLAATAAQVTPLKGLDTTSTSAWLDRLASATHDDCARHRPAFVLAAGERAYLIDGFDPAVVAAALPSSDGPALRSLNVTVLAHYLLPHVLGLAEHDGRDIGDPLVAAALAAAVDGTAVLLPPVTFHDVLRVAAEGGRMPRKSTLFLPKPASGLALRPLTERADLPVTVTGSA